MGTRPRVAVEVRPEGVVAARGEGNAGLLGAVSRVEFGEGTMQPGLRAGNVGDRAATVGAVRRTLDAVAAKGGERSRYVTLVVPDAAVRVLLLDFDALPSKAAEALAVVRFRLKKLLPFDSEQAVVSYQVMSSGRDDVRVLAVAMPCEVLAEYEGVVSEAGYVAGSVLPSTLAAIAGLTADEDSAAPALVVNAGPGAVTTAIVQGGVLVLHRTVDLGSGFGRDLEGSSSGVQGVDPRSNGLSDSGPRYDAADYDRMDAETEMQAGVLRRQAEPRMPSEANEAVQVLNESEPVSAGREVTQAVSVAAAYFEDTLGGAVPVVLSAGTMGAERLRAVLAMYGMEELEVREMVGAAALGAGASTMPLPRGWLAGVRGALRS